MKTKKRLVVVDDEKNILCALKDVLSDNYTIYTAINGTEAVGMTKRFVPDLVLLDIMLPDIDGFEVCKMLKSDDKTKGIPVVFLSAKAYVEDAKQGFESGAAAYILKPFSPEKLLEKIKFIIASAEIKRAQ